MVGTRKSAETARGGGGGRKVQLDISGPKHIIPTAATLKTTASKTWMELLNGVLKLGVKEGDGTFICTSSYSRGHPQRSGARRSKLTDKISDFIRQFARPRQRYSVRIARDDNNPARKTRQDNTQRPIAAGGGRPATRQTTGKRIPSTSNPCKSKATNAIMPAQSCSVSVPPIPSRPKVPVPITAGPSIQIVRGIVDQPAPSTSFGNLDGNALARHANVASWINQVGNSDGVDQSEDEEDFNMRSVSENEDEKVEPLGFDEDEMSQASTAVNQEEAELRREGIQDLPAYALEHLTNNFDNEYMVRMQTEIMTLKNKGAWLDLVKRAPLASYFLSELLR